MEALTDLIISGDGQLLDLQEHKGISVITISEFAQRLADEGDA